MCVVLSKERMNEVNWKDMQSSDYVAPCRPWSQSQVEFSGSGFSQTEEISMWGKLGSAVRIHFGRWWWRRVGQRERRSCTVVQPSVSNSLGALDLGWLFRVVPSHIAMVLGCWIWAAPERKCDFGGKQFSSAKTIHQEVWYLRADLAAFPAVSEVSPSFLEGDGGMWILFQAQWGATAEFWKWSLVVWFTFLYGYSACFWRIDNREYRVRRETKCNIGVKARDSVKFGPCFYLLDQKL